MSRILPILFNQAMVRAILDGRKTVTRRICKDGDDYTVPDMDFYNADKRTYAVHSYADKEHTWSRKLSIAERTLPICPGDILYVREAAMIQSMKAVGNKVKMLFAADEALVEFSVSDAEYKRLSKWAHLQRFLSPYWLTKETARTWIRITDTRAERMRDMTIEDMIREGIDTTGIITTSGPINYRVVNRFEELWDSTVKEDWQKFASNPWVWVYEFERCEKVDEVTARIKEV